MPLELIVHLAIGVAAWLITAHLFSNKPVKLLIVIVVAQLVYALIHYPIAVESAKVLQQKLTLSHYLFLLPFRIAISSISAFLLFAVSRKIKLSHANYISGFLLIALLAGGMLSIKQMQKPKEAAISNDVQAEFVTKPKNDENEDSFYIRCTHFRKTNSDDNAEQLELIEMVVTPSLKSAKLVSHDYGELKEYSDDVIAFEGIKAGTRMGFIINRGAATMSYNVNAIENGQVGRLLFKGWGTCERVKRENRV